MAHRVLFACTFEGGPATRYAAGGADSRRSFAMQDVYSSLPTVDPNTIQDSDGAGFVANGRYACRPTPIGFGDVTAAANAHIISRTQDIIWYNLYHACTGFDAEAGWADYYKTCALIIDQGNQPSQWLRIEVTPEAATPPTTIVYQVTQADTATIKVSSAAIAIGASYNLVQVRIDPGTNAIELWVNGVKTTGTADSGTSYEEAMLYETALRAGKAADAGIQSYFDDLIVTEADSGDTRIVDPMGICYQPECNVDDQWTGDYRDVDDENDLGYTPDDFDEITSGTIGHQETFNFKDEASGTLIGARLMVSHEYDQITNHRPYLDAWLDGDADHQEYELAAAIGYGHPAWSGHGFLQTPQPTPAAWGTAAEFNKFRGGVEQSEADAGLGVHEVYLIGIGTSLNRPAKTAADASACQSGTKPTGVAPAGKILKISTIEWASVKKVSTIAEASISKVSTIDAN